jgi:hypothetical protein
MKHFPLLQKKHSFIFAAILSGCNLEDVLKSISLAENNHEK